MDTAFFIIDLKPSLATWDQLDISTSFFAIDEIKESRINKWNDKNTYIQKDYYCKKYETAGSIANWTRRTCSIANWMPINRWSTKKKAGYSIYFLQQQKVPKKYRTNSAYTFTSFSLFLYILLYTHTKLPTEFDLATRTMVIMMMIVLYGCTYVCLYCIAGWSAFNSRLRWLETCGIHTVDYLLYHLPPPTHIHTYTSHTVSNHDIL